jgi:bacterioferritin
MSEKIAEGLQFIVTELSQQADGHLIQSRIFAAQGFTKLAEKFAEHSTEEHGYVEKFIDRLLDLGCEVKNGAKKETPIYKDAVEFLKYDLQVSKDGLKWLGELVEAAKCDLTTFEILAAYYKDEESDMYWAEQQLELIEMIGKQNWLVKQI